MSSLERMMALAEGLVKGHLANLDGHIVMINQHRSGRNAASFLLAPPTVVPALPSVAKPRVPVPAVTTAGMRPGTAAERKKLAVPPPWTDVMVAVDPGASLLARGRDPKGNQHSIYSSAYEHQQAAKKFMRIKALHAKIPSLDAALRRDALTNDDAAAVLLCRRLGLRPSSTKDLQAIKQSYGASTLQQRHVTVVGKSVHLEFIGKSGKSLTFDTSDPDIVAAVKARKRTSAGPDDPLFLTTALRMNKYVKLYTGGPFLVKDLRTYHANAVALKAVKQVKVLPQSKLEFQKARNAIGDIVCRELGNTRQMALGSYISPAVFDPWIKDGSWLSP